MWSRTPGSTGRPAGPGRLTWAWPTVIDDDYGDAAMTGRTAVDVLSLEDFHQRLAGRLTEVESVLRKLNTELQCRPPALGSFAHATENERRYSETHASYVAQ